MRYLLICILFPFILNASVPNKNQLILKANKGDVQAIVLLHKYYKFPETKEGLKYFNTWFKLAKKSKNKKELLNLANIYYKYNNMFINGDKKTLALYKKVYELGDFQAALKLIKLYYEFGDIKDFDKADKLFKTINKKLNTKQLIDSFIFFSSRFNKKIMEEIKSLLKQRNAKYSFDIAYSELKYELFQNKINNKVKIQELIKKTIDSKNPKNMFKLASLLNEETQLKQKINLYEEAIKYHNTNIKAYKYLGNIYKYGRKKIKKDTKKSMKYFEKASLLGDMDSKKELLIFYSNPEYLDKYFKLKNSLLQTDQGKITLASFYQSHNYKNHNELASILLEQVAKKGYKDVIIKLATSPKINNHNFDPEEYKYLKKWQEYIIKSNDFELKNRLLKKLKDSYYLKKYFKDNLSILKKQVNNKIDLKNEIAKILEEIKNLDNIISLRKKADKELYINPLISVEYYKLAASYGDVYSKKKLVDIYMDFDFRKYEDALIILKKLVEQGDRRALKKLTYIYKLYKNTKYKNNKVLEIYKKLNLEKRVK